MRWLDSGVREYIKNRIFYMNGNFKNELCLLDWEKFWYQVNYKDLKFES